MGMRGKGLVLRKSLIVMRMALTNALWKLRPGIGGVAAARISRLPTPTMSRPSYTECIEPVQRARMQIAEFERCCEIKNVRCDDAEPRDDVSLQQPLPL